MPLALTNDGRFLGLDLNRLGDQWRDALRLLVRRAPFSWLVPELRVRLRQGDGSVSFWRWRQGVASATHESGAGALTAFALAPEHVLLRQITLPLLANADVARAVQLEVVANSPFAADQTVYGYRAWTESGMRTAVRIALTSRAQVDRVLADAGLDAADPPEVWVIAQPAHAAELRPVVLPGWGAGRRERDMRHGVRRRAILLAVVLLLLAALVVTPALLARTRAAQARVAFATLQEQVKPQLAQRDALMQRVERLQQVRAVLEQQLAPPVVLDLLTRVVPDGAWLTTMRIDGTKLTLNGFADDATALVQRLAGAPGAHDVRLASPTTRRAGANKETFIIELTLDAGRYGVVATAPQGTAG